MRSRFSALLFLLLLLPGTAFAAPLPHDIYIWQRIWNAPVRSALVQANDMASGWRVLVAEADTPGTMKRVAVDWAALARTKKPVTAVIRINGANQIDREWGLVRETSEMLRDWHKAGIEPAGLEIDYDCGTARLETYARFLEWLRNLPGRPKRLSITALPAWLDSPKIKGVLAAADEVVLQVHAVLAPQSGLFDSPVARRWIDRFDRVGDKPFRVALPDYEAAVVEDSSGRIIAVESEVPRLAGGASTRNLVATPSDVAALLQSLKQAPPANLAGFVWFRLPTEQDTGTWSLATLRAVMRGAPLTGRLEAHSRPGRVEGLRDIVLANFGDSDVPLPDKIQLPSACTLADGINGYTLGAPKRPIVLVRLQSALLRAHNEELVGWMRCPEGDLSIHVGP